MNLAINDAYLFMGTNAGAGIYNDITKATQNVLIVSPYVSEEHIDILLRKQAEGVHVTLITSTDFEGNSGSKIIYKKLIAEYPDSSEAEAAQQQLSLLQ